LGKGNGNFATFVSSSEAKQSQKSRRASVEVIQRDAALLLDMKKI
jgi:hypothetical protein